METKLRKTNKYIKHKIITWSILGIVIIGVLISYFIKNLNQINAQKIEFDKRKQEINKTVEQGISSTKLQTQLTDWKNQMSKFNANLLSERTMVEFIQTLETLSAKYQLSQTIDISEKQANYSNLTIKLSGDFANFIKYLNSLENSPYYIDILSVHLQSTTISSFNKPISRPFQIITLNELDNASSTLATTKQTDASLLEAQIEAKVFWQND
jgi:Tfp pilus assembly protein PilO